MARADHHGRGVISPNPAVANAIAAMSQRTPTARMPASPRDLPGTIYYRALTNAA
jgi:hypothetical protein